MWAASASQQLIRAVHEGEDHSVAFDFVRFRFSVDREALG